MLCYANIGDIMLTQDPGHITHWSWRLCGSNCAAQRLCGVQLGWKRTVTFSPGPCTDLQLSVWHPGSSHGHRIVLQPTGSALLRAQTVPLNFHLHISRRNILKLRYWLVYLDKLYHQTFQESSCVCFCMATSRAWKKDKLSVLGLPAHMCSRRRGTPGFFLLYKHIGPNRRCNPWALCGGK